GRRNASAAYELAVGSSRPYQPGDQVSYYVAGDWLRVTVNEAAKLATSWDPQAPDENTAYYLGKLRELYEKFRPLIEQEGLVPVTEDEAAPVQGELFPEQTALPLPTFTTRVTAGGSGAAPPPCP